jgi:hypothetical protein
MTEPTELEEARAHLRMCQEGLRMVREGYTNGWGIRVTPDMAVEMQRRNEDRVLAALDRLRDAQERSI